MDHLNFYKRWKLEFLCGNVNCKPRKHKEKEIAFLDFFSDPIALLMYHG